MPTLKTYTFNHHTTCAITTTIYTYGDSSKAKELLAKHVLNVDEWYLAS